MGMFPKVAVPFLSKSNIQLYGVYLKMWNIFNMFYPNSCNDIFVLKYHSLHIYYAYDPTNLNYFYLHQAYL